MQSMEHHQIMTQRARGSEHMERPMSDTCHPCEFMNADCTRISRSDRRDLARTPDDFQTGSTNARIHMEVFLGEHYDWIRSAGPQLESDLIPT